jgi:hypothetical protein
VDFGFYGAGGGGGASAVGVMALVHAGWQWR